LFVAVAVWGAFVVWYPWIRLPDDLAGVNLYSPAKMIAARDEALDRLLRLNPIVSLAFWGVVLGACLGVGEAVARRSKRRLSAAAAACAVAGLAFGGLGGWLGRLLFVGYNPAGIDSELPKALGLQALMLGTMGGGIGLAFGTLRQNVRAAAVCTVGGLLAGSLGAVLYVFLAASLFPSVITQAVVPIGHGPRFMWLALGSVFLGLVIPALAGGSRPRRT